MKTARSSVTAIIGTGISVITTNSYMITSSIWIATIGSASVLIITTNCCAYALPIYRIAGTSVARVWIGTRDWSKLTSTTKCAIISGTEVVISAIAATLTVALTNSTPIKVRTVEKYG
jgi:hypothetical protein